ncbi:hypothetical protein CEUSTIGMA_g13166.t1 [Chlamydomonas eustigma]|uniref:Uncharacterized protein n=1 Tax=Chlamydomonas eustigma TaxID=1157962 RepID=A0A250XRN8_9CHLO|nr:hypothetical protein CEUSTIGMA_g13166.t1 [Chlamydomonas eustigma]|eukprot:GAX85751.1 hypothetical protein CEUSTIGMA_g13166.t1 [Chlamydomonas eustigma]
MSSKGWLDNASSSKGVGKYHTIYTASKNRQCSSCKMHTSDISILSKFPPLFNSMVPVVKSSSSGLPTWLLKLLLHMVPEGVTFSHISRAANSLLQTLNAEQVERRGMITAMDGMGRILISWMGGASYWDIAHHLTALALRCRHFGNKVILTYVDNPASCCTCCNVLPRCFPDLGTGLYPGDKGIRGDMNHLCALINDQNNTNHPGLALSIKEFRDSIHIVHKEDVGKPAELQRKLRPPPHAMLKIFLDWVKKYLKHGQDARTGEHMFTAAEGVRLFHRTMKQICKWYFSDPWYMDGGRCVPLDLYIRGSNDSLISFKETSIIEAGHSVSNRVRASVGDVNAAQKALAGITAAPFANVPDLETIPENPYQEEEGQQGYTTACVLSSQAVAADDLPSCSQRRAAGEVASDAIIKRVAAYVEKALREGAVNMQPVFEQVPPPLFVNDCPINWALLTPLGLAEQPTPDDPRIQPSAWCTPEFMWAFNTGSSRRPCVEVVEEVEEDVDAENGKRLEIELAHLLKGNTLIAAPNAQDTVVAAEALLQMQTSSPGAGSSKEKRLAVVKKGIHTQSTLHETFKRAAVVSGASKRRSVVSPVMSSPSKLSMPSPSNLNKGCKQQRLVCDELEPGCSNSTVQNTSGTTPMKQ